MEEIIEIYEAIIFKGLIAFIIKYRLLTAIVVCCIGLVVAIVKSRKLEKIQAEIHPHWIKCNKKKQLTYDSINYSCENKMFSEVLLPKRYRDKQKDTITIYVNRKKPNKFYMCRISVLKLPIIWLLVLTAHYSIFYKQLMVKQACSADSIH